MRLIYSDSLGRTVDAVNEALFFREPIDMATREATAEWIAARARMPGAYEPEMIAPTAADMKQGFRLFTGELVSTGAGVRHILGEEACRALVALNVDDECVDRAVEGTANAMERHLVQAQNEGGFCCRTCSVAVWRNLAVGGLNQSKRRLEMAVHRLHLSRTNDGKWGSYPFYYTLLALLEIDTAAARQELSYVAPLIEKTLKSGMRGDPAYAHRRKAVMERALACTLVVA